jgi:hypothetical protein
LQRLLACLLCLVFELYSDTLPLPSSPLSLQFISNSFHPIINSMVACSDSLVWAIVSKNNSFMKKRNGRSKRSGAVRFSSERNNLTSLATFKYSGLLSKSVGINSIVDNAKDEAKAEVVLGVASKAASFPAQNTVTIPLTKNLKKKNVSVDLPFRTAEKIILGQTANVGYRKDLKDAMLAKYSGVYRDMQRVRKIRASATVKKTGRADKKNVAAVSNDDMPTLD